MYGADVERLIGAINEVITTTRDGITALGTAGDYMLKTVTDGEHSNHSDGSHSQPIGGGGSGSHNHTGGTHYHDELAVGTSSPGTGSAKFLAEMTKINGVKSKLYKESNQINNSIGSPYSELAELEKRIGECSVGNISYMGGKQSMLAKLNNVVSAAIDAKYALLHYQNSMQQGYDKVHNGDKPSVTTVDFVDGFTDGNVKESEKKDVPNDPIAI